MYFSLIPWITKTKLINNSHLNCSLGLDALNTFLYTALQMTSYSKLFFLVASAVIDYVTHFRRKKFAKRSYILLRFEPLSFVVNRVVFHVALVFLGKFVAKFVCSRGFGHFINHTSVEKIKFQLCFEMFFCRRPVRSCKLLDTSFPLIYKNFISFF